MTVDLFQLVPGVWLRGPIILVTASSEKTTDQAVTVTGLYETSLAIPCADHAAAVALADAIGLRVIHDVTYEAPPQRTTAELFVTCPALPRTRVDELPEGYDLTHYHHIGWILYHRGATVGYGNRAYRPDVPWLVLDVDGVPLVDSRAPDAPVVPRPEVVGAPAAPPPLYHDARVNLSLTQAAWVSRTRDLLRVDLVSATTTVEQDIAAGILVRVDG